MRQSFLLLTLALSILAGCEKTYKDFEEGTFEYHLAAATEKNLDYCIRRDSIGQIIHQGVGSEEVALALIGILGDPGDCPAMREHAAIGLGAIGVKSTKVKNALLLSS
jgi:hypothetical protein